VRGTPPAGFGQSPAHKRILGHSERRKCARRQKISSGLQGDSSAPEPI